jgi:hypothetical protein
MATERPARISAISHSGVAEPTGVVNLRGPAGAIG